MKEKKSSRWFHFVVSVLLGCLLLAPLGCIYAITNMEMARYNDIYVPAVVEKSYGQIMQVSRMDMKEFITVSGTYVSAESFFMEIPELKGVYSARWLVKTGDYLEENMLIGYTEDGKTELFATESGLLREIHLGKNSYMRLESAENLALKCFVNESILTTLRKDTLALTDVDGMPVEIIEIGKIASADGTVSVLLDIGNGLCGAQSKDIKLYTGKVYTQALVVPTQCLFHLSGDTETWYVHTVDKDGNSIGNQEVMVGFSDGSYTCVSGIAEGSLLDSGYASIYGG